MEQTYTFSKDDVVRHLLSATMEADKKRAYSCVVSARVKVFSVESEMLEENLWDRQEPGITFYFSKSSDEK